ncbi:MAG: hypothetical protein K2H39_05625, partial [Paramuribaculum sp.]|nr:hypothetical protein [Paramuribaculum sp.]
MKKILLLLMAILLFAPPRANAEKKTVVFMEANKTTNYSAQTDQFNGGVQYTLATKPAEWNSLVATYTSSTSGTYFGAVRRYDSNGIDYIKIDGHPGKSGTATVSGLTWLNYSGISSMPYYRSIRAKSNQPLTFSTFCLDGKIHSVKITFYGSVTSPVTLIDNVTCPGGINAAAKKEWTFESIDPSKPIKITPAAGISGNSGNNGCMVKIEVEWEPGVLEPSPEMPEVSLRGGNYGYTYDKETETITFPTFPGTYKQILVKSAPASADKVYYTFDSSAPLPVNKSNLNGWTELTLGDAQTKATGVAFGSALIPSDDAALGDGKIYNLRLIGYNNDLDKFGAEDKVKSITCKLVRLKAPVVDITKTQEVEGQTYNEETNTVEYTGVNPIVYFTTSNVLKAETHYTIDGTNPSSSSGNLGAKVSITNFPEGFTDDQIPPVGTYNQIKILTSLNADATNNEKAYTYYDENKGEPVIVHVRRVGEAANSIVLPMPEVTIPQKGVTNLSGNVTGILNPIIVSITPAKVEGLKDEDRGELQYVFADENAIIAPEDGWQKIEDGKVTVNNTCRLFVREYRQEVEYISHYYTFNKLETTKVNTLDYNTILGLDDASTAITIDVPVRLIGSFSLSGENSTTAGNNVYLMFFADKDGNVIRVHNESTGDNPYPYDEENKYKMFKNLTGVLRKNKEMPELFLNTPSLDYSVFIDGPYAAADLKEELGENYPSYEPVLTDKVPVVSDYSKLMYFGPMRWNQETGEFTDNYGGSVKLYDRIETEIGEVSKLEERLADGVQYRIAGYVGYADGALVIMPRAIVAAPRLLAPNPVNPDAAPDQLIDMNVISDNLIISVNTDGLSDNAKLIFVKVPDVEAWLDDNGKFDPAKVDWTNQEERDNIAAAADNANANEIEITAEDLGGDGDCALAVKLSNEGFESALVAVNFIKHDATSVNSIEDFKNEVIKLVSGDDKKYDGFDDLPLNTDDTAEHDYYRFDGLARVREVTPHYLYIRTTPGDGSNLPDDADLSAHSMLLYNKDGWDHPVAGIKLEASATDTPVAPQAETEATTPEVTSAPAPIKAGDVITNFALIPTKSKFGNLIGYTTGFARTFRRVDNAEGGSNDPMEKNVQDEENFTPFAEGDRMLRYTVKNAKVGRIVVDSKKPDTDPTKFQY